MDRVLKVTAGVLFLGLALLYIAAKVHFFARLDMDDISGYWAEHWPYSLGLLVVALAFVGVCALIDRRARG